MPVYCYRCKSCQRVTEMFLHAHNPPARRRCQCGRVACRDYISESAPRAVGVGEIRSISAGVMPHQAKHATRSLAQRGIDGVRFDTRTGDAIFRDRPTKLKALRTMGLYDKDEIRG